MSDYQHVTVKHIDGATIRLQVTEVHPDMTELDRIVDRKRQIRKSLARRLRNFAALLLLRGQTSGPPAGPLVLDLRRRA